jgi:hypothetical protein
MELQDDLKAHQRRENDKAGSWKLESPHELQEDLIKGAKGISIGWSHQAR